MAPAQSGPALPAPQGVLAPAVGPAPATAAPAAGLQAGLITAGSGSCTAGRCQVHALASAVACVGAFVLGGLAEGARRRAAQVKGAGSPRRIRRGGGRVVAARAAEEASDVINAATAAVAGEVLGRANLLRASWWPLPLRGKKAEDLRVAQTLERAEDSSFGSSPEEELAMLRKKGPMKVAMLGTRECPYQHQQEIELLSEARVMRGDHIYTSGSTGTNASVIKGALKARRPELLTVVLPQSMGKQDRDSQKLLRACQDQGVQVKPMPENDRLPLAEAAKLCNSSVLGQVEKLIAFASHESGVYLSLIEEAKSIGLVATAFYLD